MTIDPTRRSVLKTGAWAAPAIVVAGAAPVFAASPAVLVVTNGTTAIARNPAVPTYDGLRFQFFTVKVNAAVPANGLSLTLSATTSSGTPAFVYTYDRGAQEFFTRVDPWVSPSPQETPIATARYDYPGALSAGTTVTATGDAVLVLNGNRGAVINPIVTVVVSAPGFASVTRQFQSTNTG